MRVVFDCVVFAQALINNLGPAAGCLDLARSRRVDLIWSEFVISEIRELPPKLPARLLMTPDRVEALIQDVATFSRLVDTVPDVYQHPLDSDDSHYVNLAIAAGAALITSRDRHLLDLMDNTKPEGRDFRQRFPQLSIVLPEGLLDHVRRSSGG